MGKSLIIAEKPSVAKEFARVLSIKGRNGDGFIEGEKAIVTWCVGHLVTMSYPEAYDMALKKWSLGTIPFLPETYKYQVIDSAAKQFGTVSALLRRDDVDTIYVATDSGREGEYIYRLVEQESHISGKKRLRVWIDSQTEDEIKRGVREAKDLSEYDDLAASAYLRAKEDYLMGINFSRALSLKYGDGMARFLNEKYVAVAVGRVMTCVLGMVVDREREIRQFVKTPFFKVSLAAYRGDDAMFRSWWKVWEKSAYYGSPALYRENGFKKSEDAQLLMEKLGKAAGEDGFINAPVVACERKKDKKNPPLLYNLAELQNMCSKLFKISPDETLNVVQELYEKKLVTYPRTDARVLSSAVAKEIDKNLKGLTANGMFAAIAKDILQSGSYRGLEKTRYVNDKQITDHYAIIPTGAGQGALPSLRPLHSKVYEVIVRRFLAIFYGPCVYSRMSVDVSVDIEGGSELFHAVFKVMTDPGYMKVTAFSFAASGQDGENRKNRGGDGAKQDDKGDEEDEEQGVSPALLDYLKTVKKGSVLSFKDPSVKEGETSPPKRYNSGSMILAMENAGSLIEDEELREHIKGSGIGTSATRAEILKKLVSKKYLSLNKKTQIITPGQLGEMVYEAVKRSIPQLLNPKLTASWEKGLSMVAAGEVSEGEYMKKLNDYVAKATNRVKEIRDTSSLGSVYASLAPYYRSGREQGKTSKGRISKKNAKEQETDE